MRRTIGVSLLVVCVAALACKKKDADGSSGSAGSTAAAETRVQFKPPPVGTKYSQNEAMSMTFSIAVSSNGKVLKSANMKKSEVHDTKAEVLASNDVAPTRVRVTYVRREDTETDVNGKEDNTKSPLGGNTYLVEKNGSDTSVTRIGGDATKKEIDEVKKDNKDLGKRDPFQLLLPDRALTKGEKITASKDAVRQMFASDDDSKKMDVDKVELVFQGTRADGARTVGDFSMNVGFTDYPEATMGLEMQLTGTLSVDMAKGWPTAVSLTGPIVVKGEDPKHHLQITGEGKMNMTMSYTYE